MTDRKLLLLLELLITANDEASKELEVLKKRLNEVGDGAENAGQRTKILQEAMGEFLGKLGKAATIGVLVTGFVDANRESELLAKQFRAMTGDAQAAGEEIDFLRGVADRWGLAVNELAPAHLRLSAATKGTTAEGAKTRQMMEDLAAAYVNAGAGTEDLEESMEILGETFAEGRVSIDDIKEGMQEDMPPAIQAATTAVLENDEALKKMMATGSAATEDFMPAFAAALRKHIGGSATHIDSSAAALSRVQEEMKALYVEINSVIPIMTVFDGTIKGLAKTAEIAIGGLSTVTKGVAFVGNAMGAAAGALSQGEDVMAAVGAEADKTGSAIEKTALHLVGLKTETELATERQAQMKAELQEAAAAADPYGTSLEALKNKLKDAHEEFARTGDIVKLTQTALQNFFKMPEQHLNTEGVLKLAATLKSVGDQAEDSGHKISDTLGQELSKLTDEQLKKLEAQARKAMAEASQGSETSRKAFAELGQVVEGVVLARLQRLGVDGPDALRGMSTAAKSAIDDFTALARHGELSAETLEKAFTGVLAQMDNPHELKAFQEEILKLGKSGKLSGEQVERALLLIRQQLQELRQDSSIEKQVAALNRLSKESVDAAQAQGSLIGAQRDSLKASYDVAIAKGREAEAHSLLIELARNEANQATNNARIKNIEAEAAFKTLTLLEKEAGAILATGQATDEAMQKRLTSARVAAETAAIEAAAAGQVAEAERQKAAAVSLGNVGKQAATSASKENTKASKENTESTNENAKAVEGAAKSGGDLAKTVASLIDAWREKTAALSEATKALFEWKARLSDVNPELARDTVGGISDEASKATKKIGELTGFIKKMEEQMLYSTNSVGHFMDFVSAMGATAERAYYEQKLAAEALEKQFEKTGEAGAGSFDSVSGSIEMVNSSLQQAKRGLFLLNEQDLKQLEEAAGKVNQKLRQMQEETESARQRLADLNAEILDEQGQDQQANLLRQQIEYQQQLADIERQRKEAELQGNRELLELLDEQKRKLDTLNRLKIDNIQKEKPDASAVDRTADSYRTLGDELERVNRLTGTLARSDLSEIVGQANALRSTLADVSALL